MHLCLILLYFLGQAITTPVPDFLDIVQYKKSRCSIAYIIKHMLE